MNSQLPAERLDELRRAIHTHLKRGNVYDQVRSFVREFVQEREASSGTVVSEDELVRVLHEKDVIRNVLRGLSTSPSYPSVRAVSAAAAGHSGRMLHVRVCAARAFVDLTDDEALTGCTFQIHCCLNSQRGCSRPVTASSDPAVDDSVLFTLPDVGDPLLLADSLDLLHMVAVLNRPGGSSQLIGANAVDWRKCLIRQVWTATVELRAFDGTSVPAGIVEISVEMLPRGGSFSIEDKLARRIALVRDGVAAADRSYFNYAKKWWQEYLSVGAHVNHRLIKLLAQAEDGSSRCVSSFLQPIQARHALLSAGEAARFVSSISTVRHDAVAGSKSDVWLSLHSVLASRSGDIEAHAVLLCSIFLGLELDAYVVLGHTTSDEPHMWVMTFGDSDAADAAWRLYLQRVLPPRCGLTQPVRKLAHHVLGKHHQYGAKAVAHKYSRVHCVFNAHNLWANVARDDSVAATAFELHNPAAWKAMDASVVAQVFRNRAPCIKPSTINVADIERSLELDVIKALSRHRSSQGMTFTVDERLGYLLSPALAAYEAERVQGAPYGNAEFQSSIRRFVPEGHTFKAFPFSAIHSNAAQLVEQCLLSPVGRDILATPGGGDLARFGVRLMVKVRPPPRGRIACVRVTLEQSYAEDCLCIWLMVAVM